MTNPRDSLGKEVIVKIDRALGDKHSDKYPRHIYPINYGYIENTISGDDEELDAYILGVYEPLKEFKGICKAIIHRLETDDDKLIVMPHDKNYTNNEIKVLTEFQERFFESTIIREDNYLEFSKLIPEMSVKSLQESLNFFTTCGFKIEYSRPENKFAFLSLGSIQFMIQEETHNDKWELAPLTYPYGNGINFQLEVDNVEKIKTNLINAGFEIKFDIEENWYRQGDKLLGNKEFLVLTPDGYLLRFSEDLGEKTNI